MSMDSNDKKTEERSRYSSTFFYITTFKKEQKTASGVDALWKKRDIHKESDESLILRKLSKSIDLLVRLSFFRGDNRQWFTYE